MPLPLRDVWGNKINLAEERMTYLLEHPEMREQEGKLGETLLAPDVVIQSQTDDTVRLFYRFYRRLNIGDKYLCIVVKYTRGDIFIRRTLQTR